MVIHYINDNYRIKEYEDHFRVCRKRIVKIYWLLLWFIPLFVKEKRECWDTVMKNGHELDVRNAFNYDSYYFVNKEDCVDFINELIEENKQNGRRN